MPLITFLVLIAVVGLIVGLIVTYIPMPPPFKNIIIVVSLIAVILACLHAFGLLDGLMRVRI